MLSGSAKLLIPVIITALSVPGLPAQTIPAKPASGPKRVEAGLENAVKWKWRVEPSQIQDWGLPVNIPTPAPTPTPSLATPVQPAVRPTLYEIKPGDALFLIGKKYSVPVAQLKAFNGLKDDKIRAGQFLKIPTIAELSAMTAPPVKQKGTGTPAPKPSPELSFGLERLRMQFFLDREQFSAGPLVGEPGLALTRVLLAYQGTHEDAKDDASLAAKASAALPDLFSRYKLRAEDFRFIAPPKPVSATLPPPRATVRGRPRKAIPPVAAKPPITYEDLTAETMLPYPTPWEFVAERFHCQETYLHNLNEKLPAVPAIGAEFQVPNVIPFEIENAFNEPLQPKADPQNPVTAAVIGLSQLNIYRNGTLVAVLPLSSARPGLHGRNTWTILDAIPRPRLATSQEEWKAQPRGVSAGGGIEPVTSPVEPIPKREQFLAAGPRNPVGILWINLAKAKSTEPLPYGLHGTSIPDEMNVRESLGGFRLTNWDIARAVRLLPSGTPLQWK